MKNVNIAQKKAAHTSKKRQKCDLNLKSLAILRILLYNDIQNNMTSEGEI